MLFKKKTVSEKIEHLVKKNDFYVLADYVHGTKEEKLARIHEGRLSCTCKGTRS